MKKVEEDGWIFASNGKAFVGVKFLDGGYQWDEKRAEATPANFTGHGDTTRILLHAGDLATHGSFEQIPRDACAPIPCVVTADKVDYRFGGGRTPRNDPLRRGVARKASPSPHQRHARRSPAPRPAYQSPYLNANFGSDHISVTVGPVTRVLDFSEQDGRILRDARCPDPGLIGP